MDYDRERSDCLEFKKRLKDTFAYLGVPIPSSSYDNHGPTITNNMHLNNYD